MDVAAKAVAAVLALVCVSTEARKATYTQHQSSAPSTKVGESQLSDHGIYVNSIGQVVHQPAHG